MAARFKEPAQLCRNVGQILTTKRFQLLTKLAFMWKCRIKPNKRFTYANKLAARGRNVRKIPAEKSLSKLTKLFRNVPAISTCYLN